MVKTINDPWVFFGVSSILIGYLLYTMIRNARAERPGVVDREPEL